MWALLLKIPALIQPLIGALTGINFSAVGTFLSGVWSNIVKHWQLCVVFVLIAFSAFNVWQLNTTTAKFHKEQAAHAADIASFKQAQTIADNKAQAEKVILQKESKADADQADASYATLFAKYKSSLLRYTQQDNGGAGTVGNNQLPPTEGGNGPSEGAKLSITVDDGQICAENTARLQAVHDWAIKLPQNEGKP